MLLCTAKEATVLYNILCTEVSSQLFVYHAFPVNSLDKALGLSYIFTHISTGHTPFPTQAIPVRLSGRYVPLFFSCVMHAKPKEGT